MSAVSRLEQEIGRLKELAASENWHEREDAGFSIRNLMEAYFGEVMHLTSGWLADPSPRIRRAVCLGCMQRKSKTPEQRIPLILRRLEVLMRDDDIYVRKCCGPFVVGYLGYTYPTPVLPWLYKMAQEEDENVVTNVVKAFSQALGRRFPVDAAKTLSLLRHDERARVRSALKASIRNVAKTETGLAALRDHEPEMLAMIGRN